MSILDIMYEPIHIEDGTIDIPVVLTQVEFPFEHAVYNFSGHVMGEILTEFVDFFERYNKEPYRFLPSHETFVYLKVNPGEIQIPCSILNFHVKREGATYRSIDGRDRAFIETSVELDFAIVIPHYEVEHIKLPDKKPEKKVKVIHLTKFDIMDI